MTSKYKESFEHYVKKFKNGCWQFKKEKDVVHSRLCFRGKLSTVLKAAYENMIGPVPNGFKVEHTCDNSDFCVNPDHLRLYNSKQRTIDKRVDSHKRYYVKYKSKFMKQARKWTIKNRKHHVCHRNLEELWKEVDVDVENGTISRPVFEAQSCKSKDKYIFCVIKGRTYFVHRLVWMKANNKFIPQNREINHKNGIKSDNRISNLELVTRKQNLYHASVNKLHERALKEQGKISNKVTEKMFEEMLKMNKEGKSISKISKKYKLNYLTVRRAFKKKNTDINRNVLINKRKLRYQDAEDIRKMRNLQGISMRELSEKFGVSKSCVERIISGKTYTDNDRRIDEKEI